MSTATVKPTTVRIEEGLKEQATEFLDTVGLSLNSYLNLASAAGKSTKDSF